MRTREDATKTPPVLAGLLGLIVVLLLVSIALQAGVVNPTAQSTQSEVRRIACAIAEQTANGSRVRTEDPKSHELETRKHFLTRLLAQRHTLIIAAGTGCASAPGFPPFDVQVARALREIDRILGYRPSRDRQAQARGHGVAAPATQPASPALAVTSVPGAPASEPAHHAAPAEGHGPAPAPHGHAPSPSPPSTPAAPSEPVAEPSVPAPAPTPTTPAPPTQEPPPAPPVTPPSKGGVVGNPGGAAGEVLCGIGDLAHLPICTE